ncbi:uncharacterized protein LOC114786461 [Denticeps clupeoides]|uniref:uncharacterized protein LOC114786461 n=1 Tax=Denticeps clupeoides TaxID=299321 RepID=UPI0010A4F52D|nr:uncharacterized protein LOC114786461 [Denticeps clupeoides]
MMRYLLLVLLLKTVQNELLKTFTPGHVASLRCVLSPGPENYLFWFKHTSGHAPVCIVSYYPSTNQFFAEERFNATKEREDFILTISNATPSDAGWYYCGFRHSDLIAFSHGVYLSEERAEMVSRYEVKQTMEDSETSLPLRCTQPGGCDGERGVHWFRPGSAGSRPGFLYSRCGRGPEAVSGPPSGSCAFHLPRRNLSTSRRELCAVAACGEILIKQDPAPNATDSFEFNKELVALTTSNILCFIIAVSLFCTRRRNKPPLSDGPPLSPQLHNEELNYATMSFSKRRTKRRGAKSEADQRVIYSSVQRHGQRGAISSTSGTGHLT